MEKIPTVTLSFSTATFQNFYGKVRYKFLMMVLLSSLLGNYVTGLTTLRSCETVASRKTLFHYDEGRTPDFQTIFEHNTRKFILMKNVDVIKS